MRLSYFLECFIFIKCSTKHFGTYYSVHVYNSVIPKVSSNAFQKEKTHVVIINSSDI